ARGRRQRGVVLGDEAAGVEALRAGDEVVLERRAERGEVLTAAEPDVAVAAGGGGVQRSTAGAASAEREGCGGEREGAAREGSMRRGSRSFHGEPPRARCATAGPAGACAFYRR